LQANALETKIPGFYQQERRALKNRKPFKQANMSDYATFKQLHQNETPLLLANIWDVNSAKLFEANGYLALGISSSAIANAFGFADGENIPFELLVQVSKRVTESVRIPLSVDIEGGFSRSIPGILDNITRLHDAGVVGINLEDTIPGEQRDFLPVDVFLKILSAVAAHIGSRNMGIFINVRTDAFLLGKSDALGETITRTRQYEASGASGIFVPCITQVSDISEVVSATSLPVNVMCMPELPDFGTLASVGVKRISMGPFLFNKVYAYASDLSKTIAANQNFSALFS
jgi:2-methylisocitrate lyase-like PEP mutase family enzyme